MVNTKMRYKFRPEWFETYGLDKRKNMLQSPICPCGCGEKATLIAETTEELTNLAASLLMEFECCHCALFAHCMNGDMIAFIKVMDEDDENVDIFSSCLEGGDMEYFHLIDEDFEFHNYGLLIEKAHGEWKIIED